MISIIIPLYNKEKSIARTIESVFSQSYQDWELLILDDGSTDNSAKIVAEYTYDQRVNYIYKTNSGVSSTRNMGIELARGEWILCLDADDYFFPTTLETLLNATVKFEVKIAAGNFYSERQNKRISVLSNIKEGVVINNFKSLFWGRFDIRAGATLFKSEVLQAYKYDFSLKRYEDAKLEFDIIREHKVAIVSDYVMVYSLDDSGLSRPSNNIKNDFISCLNFQNKSFWEKMVLGRLLSEGLDSYPDKISFLRNLYKFNLFWAYLSNLLGFINKIVLKFKNV